MKHDQADLNRKKYAGPPSVEKINAHIKFLDMTSPHFEKYFGIPDGTIALIRIGKRDLPVRFWHIIYEKKKTNRAAYRKRKSVTENPTKNPTESIPKQPQSGILSKIKDITSPGD